MEKLKRITFSLSPLNMMDGDLGVGEGVQSIRLQV